MMVAADVLSLLVGFATPSPSPGVLLSDPGAFWTGPVIAAFVAAGVALLAAVGNVLVQLRMQRRLNKHQEDLASDQHKHELRLEHIARAFTKEQQDVEWRVRQLNELYGPLQMYKATSRNLRLSLPQRESDGETRWRLVENIADAKKMPHRPTVEAILEINKQIEQLLITKAGLMDAEAPYDSFETFMQHSVLLRSAWSRSDNGGPKEAGVVHVSEVPYPDAFDSQIDEAVRIVRDYLTQARSKTN